MTTRIYFLYVAALFFLFSCKKGGKPEEPQEDIEKYTAEQVQMLDNATAVKLTLNDIVLPNDEIAGKFLPDFDTAFFNHWSREMEGIEDLGPLDAKNALLKQITAVALNLTDRSRHPYAGQNGIAYSYGAKDYKVKQKPPSSLCQEPVNGLDCSGFLWQVFSNVGIKNFPDGPANQQRKAETIQHALETSFPKLKKVKVEDLGRLETGKFMSGDIVYFSNNGAVFHIGIVAKDRSGNLILFNSSGSQGASPAECEKNKSLSRGPRSVKLDNTYWFGQKMQYAVVRFNFEISGKWDMHFRCQNTSTDAFVLHLNFPPSERKEFTLDQDYTDYDGSLNHAKIHLKYDNTTNVLSSDMINTDGSLPGFERKDSFTLKLKRDDSGYLPAQLVYLNGGTGCPAEFRLVNKE